MRRRTRVEWRVEWREGEGVAKRCARIVRMDGRDGREMGRAGRRDVRMKGTQKK